MPKPTEFVATVIKPKRNTPIKRQKAKKLIKPVELEPSPTKSFIKFIKSFGSPSPKKKTPNNFTNNNKEINKRLNEAKKQANKYTSPLVKKRANLKVNKPLKRLF
tara:strand:- start:1244 stop:1558 length:315 start_codon:yes stop_codon:yes gene_type:complete